MKRFIEGENRTQSTLFPESLEDYIAQDNAIRIVDAFVNKLDLIAQRNWGHPLIVSTVAYRSETRRDLSNSTG